MEAIDARGLPLTAESDAALAAVDYFVARLIRIDRGAEAILEAAKSFPGTAMIQLSAGAFWLFGQSPASDSAAKTYLDAAEPLLADAGERERMLHGALRRWWGRDHLGAVEALEQMTAAAPRDILAAKICEFLYYVLGQQQEGPRFLAHMERIAAANAGDPDFLAMHGFANELCGNADLAESLAEQAIERDLRTPWAHHCLAHVYLCRGDAEAGVRRLEALLPLWMGAGRVIHCHNAWHLAVAALDLMDVDRARALFERHIWGITPDLKQEQLDAIALAWRMEMAGHQLDSLWPSLARSAEGSASDAYMPYINAHLIYALARAGRGEVVDSCLAKMRERTKAEDREALRTWRPAGLAVVEACAAFGAGENARAAALLGSVIDRAPLVGGSDAQVDLFRQTYLCSLLGAGRKAEARAYWQKTTAARKLTALDRYWLGLAS